MIKYGEPSRTNPGRWSVLATMFLLAMLTVGTARALQVDLDLSGTEVYCFAVSQEPCEENGALFLVEVPQGFVTHIDFDFSVTHHESWASEMRITVTAPDGLTEVTYSGDDHFGLTDNYGPAFEVLETLVFPPYDSNDEPIHAAGTWTVRLWDSASDTQEGRPDYTIGPDSFIRLLGRGPPPQADYGSTDWILYQGEAINMKAVVLGGMGSTSFTAQGQLPAGLELNEENGTISGAPASTVDWAEFAVIATEVGTAYEGVHRSTAITATVVPVLQLPDPVAPLTLTEGVEMLPFVPGASGGYGTLQYSIEPALPPGLALNASTGRITGTPEAAWTERAFRLTVTDSNYRGRSIILSIGSGHSPLHVGMSMTLLKGVAMAPLSLPIAGGDGAYTFTVEPALPNGLSMNPSTGVISGIPAAAAPAAVHAVTVTDGAGTKRTVALTLTVHAGATGVTVSPASLALFPGNTAELEALVSGEGDFNEAVSYSSSNSLVAVVNHEGRVTAIAEGVSTMTVNSLQYPEITATVEVTVLPIPQGEGVAVAVSPAEAFMLPGETARFIAAVTGKGDFDSTVAWSSSDQSIAVVSPDGLVVAVAPGTAVITASSNQTPPVQASARITVGVEAYPPEATPVADGITLEPAVVSMFPGDTFALSASVAGEGDFDAGVTWTSANPDIAAVSGAGVVTAVSPGVTIVTAASTGKPGIRASAAINVRERSHSLSVTASEPSAIEVEAGTGDVELIEFSLEADGNTDVTVSGLAFDVADLVLAGIPEGELTLEVLLDALQLTVDGVPVAAAAEFAGSGVNFSFDAPLVLGSGTAAQVRLVADSRAVLSQGPVLPATLAAAGLLLFGLGRNRRRVRMLALFVLVVGLLAACGTQRAGPDDGPHTESPASITFTTQLTAVGSDAADVSHLPVAGSRITVRY